MYLAPQSRKMPQQHWAVVNVPSVRWHIRCVTDRPSGVA